MRRQCDLEKAVLEFSNGGEIVLYKGRQQNEHQPEQNGGRQDCQDRSNFENAVNHFKPADAVTKIIL